MVTTVLQCFNEEQPSYPVNNEHARKIKGRKVKTTSELIAKQNPPNLLIRTDPDHMVQKATAFLTSTKAATLANRSVSDPGTASAPLWNEADVIRVANLYLMDPIAKAIGNKYTTPITQSMEFMHGPIRLDQCFNIYDDHPSREKKTLMIVEFKRRGLIRPNEFQDGSCDVLEYDNRLQEMKENEEQFSLENTKNALNITKQATAYCVQRKCNFAALCDYDNLVLLEMDNLPKTAKVTIVPRQFHRKALLGFLIMACEYERLG
ncbi:hypothetical protein BKA66DRAFT_570018 [Pyrenochaeta sp. MPI-SDFR-AT-0127]|nr:hypothetical protein BKA66DRAFT_570018 [Pyrenochaeta sp. MPI-SDFR-AT-0127]